ncbi:MAG: DUF2809 domain-containing protein [Leptolyngbya sp. RL_3_1]|nr:DUF2809 domain-containing protein [Leptolyngbya sp. RL_3_1]
MRYSRSTLLISLGIIVPFGLVTKFYGGRGAEWLNDTFGGIPYEIFWILLVAWFWPRGKAFTIALSVFVATCLLEVLQLWQPPWLQAIRATLPGRLVLGNTFTWSDFPYYAIGCGLGWLWLRVLERRSPEANQS